MVYQNQMTYYINVYPKIGVKISPISGTKPTVSRLEYKQTGLLI